MEKVAVDPARSEDSLGREANLPSISVAGSGHGRRDLIQVSIRHDDQRTIGTQFHRNLFNAGHAADPFADISTAREGNLAHAAVRDELASGTGETLDPFRWKPGLEQNFGELQSRKWRIRGRLDYHGVAGRQCRPDLVTDQIKREVEGTDGCYNAARYSQGKADLLAAARVTI